MFKKLLKKSNGRKLILSLLMIVCVTSISLGQSKIFTYNGKSITLNMREVERALSKPNLINSLRLQTSLGRGFNFQFNDLDRVSVSPVNPYIKITISNFKTKISKRIRFLVFTKTIRCSVNGSLSVYLRFDGNKFRFDKGRTRVKFSRVCNRFVAVIFNGVNKLFRNFIGKKLASLAESRINRLIFGRRPATMQERIIAAVSNEEFLNEQNDILENNEVIEGVAEQEEEEYVNELADVTFNVYPNPTTSVINIESSVKVKQVTIYDINGSVVGKYTTNLINVESYTSGLYMAEVIDENNNRQVVKFIKK